MISIGQVKLSNLPAKLSAFGPKTKRILKIFKKTLRFLDQNLYWKLIFFRILYEIFLEVLTPLKKYIPLEDNTRFLQQFFRFRVGGTFRRPPSRRYWWPSQEVERRVRSPSQIEKEIVVAKCCYFRTLFFRINLYKIVKITIILLHFQLNLSKFSHNFANKVFFV